MAKIIPLLSIYSILWTFTGCGSQNHEKEGSAEPKTPVTITSISIEPILETIELNATSGFLKKNIVKSPTTGLVENIEINPGDYVEKGQLLFTIKTKEASALEKSQISDSSLYFRGLIKIKAPKTGIITSVAHQKGDYIQEGDELSVIAEQSSLVFLLEVPFELDQFIIKNANCKILLPGNKLLQGKVLSKLPAMDVLVQTERFIIKPSATEHLPENLIAKISIVKTSKTKACVLPKSAILANEALTDFWVMKLINDTIAIKIPVIKGIEQTNKVEILQPAFESSDRILLTGNYGLADTARVTIQKP